MEGVFENGGGGIWEWWRGYLGAIGGGGIWGWWRGYLELVLGSGVFALGFG